MIKSNRIITDIAGFKTLKPQGAKGHVCIELTDPLTGKVKERVAGENTIFSNVLFWNMLYYAAYNSNPDFVPWNNLTRGLSTVLMALNNDNTAIDTNFPFLRGQTVGYGKPSTGSSGLYRGAYNAANQVLGELSATKQRWKFQYDFTTAQANGVAIKNIGLTYQYLNVTDLAMGPPQGVCGTLALATAAANYNACSGRYSVSITAAGIVTVRDIILGTVTTIDISAIVCSTTSEYKDVGYNPSNGYWYIWKYSSTAGNRRMYVFTDQTFSSLSTTYSPSNISISNSASPTAFYVYGNYMYYFPRSGTTIYVADFVNNAAQSSRTPNMALNNALSTEGVSALSGYFNTIGTTNGVFILQNTNASQGSLYDAVNDVLVVAFNAKLAGSNGVFLYPLLSNLALPACLCAAPYQLVTSPLAVSTYILASPVTKTSANGMTATYEVEVYW